MLLVGTPEQFSEQLHSFNKNVYIANGSRTVPCRLAVSETYGLGKYEHCLNKQNITVDFWAFVVKLAPDKIYFTCLNTACSRSLIWSFIRPLSWPDNGDLFQHFPRGVFLCSNTFNISFFRQRYQCSLYSSHSL